MSYLVLARKARPRNFSEVVGQKPVVRTLQNAIVQDRVAHAMIFSGVRGVGKTTLARIMAKALNCEDRSGAEPCNRCRSCLEINGGSSVDLVEIDGASNRGIQEIRELKENIRFMPAASRFKVIIIDEVHMLTTEAFNALLKTLEEPPRHVYFMFATTELHKVPVTILSRCQRYELKRVGSRELTEHFSALALSEGVEIEPAALALIVREAAGSVRDGLSLLDQVFSYCGSKVTASDLTDILGLVSHRVVADIVSALLAGDLDAALGQLDQVYEFGMDSKRFINDLLAWCRALVICRVSRNPERLVDLPEEQMATLKECAGRFSPGTLMLLFNLLLEQLERAGYSSQPRFALEMAFIKAVQVREVVPVTSLLARFDQVLAAAGNAQFPEVSPQPAPAGQNARLASAEPREAAPPEKKNLEAQLISSPATSGDAGIKPGAPPASAAGSAPETLGEADAAGRQPAPERRGLSRDASTKTVRHHWHEFVGYVRERKEWMASALRQAGEVEVQGDELIVHFENPADCRLLKNRENITLLTEFALDFFQVSYRISFVLPDSDACAVDPMKGVTPQQERQFLAKDALVLTAVDVFSGEIGDIRVGPHYRTSMVEPEQDERHGPDESE
ncbi:MAG: DNA polymerase III subunit gamma/tau [Desulfobulbaceae bacterium]